MIELSFVYVSVLTTCSTYSLLHRQIGVLVPGRARKWKAPRYHVSSLHPLALELCRDYELQ